MENNKTLQPMYGGADHLLSFVFSQLDRLIRTPMSAEEQAHWARYRAESARRKQVAAELAAEQRREMLAVKAMKAAAPSGSVVISEERNRYELSDLTAKERERAAAAGWQWDRKNLVFFTASDEVAAKF